MRQRRNGMAILEMSCYMLMGAALFYMVISKSYLSFVTPKMKGYLLFSGVVFFVWGFSLIWETGKPKYKRSINGSFFLTGLILFSCLYIKIAGENQAVISFNVEHLTTEVFFNTSRNKTEASRHGIDKQKHMIIAGEEDFLYCVSELLQYGTEYEGYQVRLTGKVYLDGESQNREEFYLSRMMMSCCAADLIPIAIRCVAEEDVELFQEKWVNVYGIVTNLTNGECVIEAQNIILTTKPEEEYLYGK